MSSRTLEISEDEDEKLSFDADKVGPGFGCTSPLQSKRMLSQVIKQTLTKIIVILIVKLTFFKYVSTGKIL